MFLNWQYYSFPAERVKSARKILSFIEGLKEVQKNTKNLSDVAKSIINSGSVVTKKEIDSIIQREHWIIELSQVTDRNSGDAKEHRWVIKSLEDIHFQRFYKDHVGSIPEVFITVRDREEEIFSMSLTEWNEL